jgi:hypothetical protein
MRITVLRQQLKALVTTAPSHDLAKLDAEFERIKSYLRRGVHLLLQVRVQVLNEDLRATCARWHPAMRSIGVSPQLAASPLV